MAREKICGIYKITNIINSMMYIGKSIDISGRLHEHKSLLNRNVHNNSHLQNSWNKYGKENFSFDIVEECEEIIINEKETFFIKLYKSYDGIHGYNKTLGGDGGKFTEDHRLDHIDLFNELLGLPIYQLNLDGTLVKEWSSASKASRELGILHSVIWKCLHKKRRTYKNYIWVYVNDSITFNKADYINGMGLQKKKVSQLDRQGNLIKEWESSCSTEEEGFDRSAVTACCKGRRKSHKGFIWRYNDSK